MYRRKYGKRYPARRYGVKRRVVRRKRTYGKKTSFLSSQRGNVNTGGYRRAVGGWRRKKQLMWDASSVLDKHRSYAAAAFFLTPSLGNNIQINNAQMISSAFWLTGNGAITQFSPAAASYIFIRGGMARCRVSNGPFSPVYMNVWLVRTTNNTGGPPTAAVRNVGWDPATDPDSHESYRVLKTFEFVIAGNESQEIKMRIPTHRVFIDDDANNENRYFWVFGSSTIGSTVTTNQVTVVTSFNLSYTGDNIGTA